MNITATKFDKSIPIYQAVTNQNVKEEKPQQPDIKNNKNFFDRNKVALCAIGAIALGGIAFVATRGNSKSLEPKTHIERLNCFGKKIIEDLKLDETGKIIQKEIKHEGIKYIAHYKDGKLTDVGTYFPRKLEDFTDEKYSILKEIIDEKGSELVASQKFGNSTKYWLFDKTGESVTQINEIQVDVDAIYQYGNCRLNSESSFAYEIDETFSPKDNIPFGEIFECFKKGLI